MLERRRDPFDDPEWLFELKADGFRGLLYIAEGTGRLISRNCCELRRFRPLADDLGGKLKVETAILDGEVVVKDASGRDIFLELLRRRGNASYVAFDLLWLNGRDLLAEFCDRLRVHFLLPNPYQARGKGGASLGAALASDGATKPRNLAVVFVACSPQTVLVADVCGVRQ